MNELDKNKKLAEILKLARLSLNDEFMNKYAESHQAWQVACNQAWITKGMLLPYSNKFVYPTEQEIVAKAVEIYNTLTPTERAGLVENVPAPSVTETVQPENVVPTEAHEAVVEEPIIEVEPVAEELPRVEEPVVVDVPFSEATILEEAIEKEKEPELESKFKSLFTKWGGKGSY